MIPFPVCPSADLLNTFNGLPTHPLVVHFAVALASIAAVAGVVYALIPRFRRWLSMPLLTLGVASIVLGLITPSSGKQLEKRVRESALVHKHAELGDQMGTILIVYGTVLIVTMLVVRFRSPANDSRGITAATPAGVSVSPAAAPAVPSGSASPGPVAPGVGVPAGSTPTAIDRIGGMPGSSLRAFPGQPQIAAGLTVLVLVGAVVSGVMIYRTGDSGAKSVWDTTPAAAPKGSGGR